jgi:hypothetical protein
MKSSDVRIGMTGAIMTTVGTLLSGPLSILVISLVKTQPEWVDPSVFVENYHRIQSLTFYFGFLLIAGSILMLVSIYQLSEDKGSPLVGLVFTAIAAGLIFFNYLTQTTFIPALVAEYTPAAAPIIAALSMSNPTSIAWAIEMWGYGFPGIGTWLAAGFFSGPGVERTAKFVFILNGVLSVIGALWTALDLGWVLSVAGLIAFGLWNLLYVVLAIVFLLVLRRRQIGSL